MQRRWVLEILTLATALACGEANEKAGDSSHSATEQGDDESGESSESASQPERASGAEAGVQSGGECELPDDEYIRRWQSLSGGFCCFPPSSPLDRACEYAACNGSVGLLCDTDDVVDRPDVCALGEACYSEWIECMLEECPPGTLFPDHSAGVQRCTDATQSCRIEFAAAFASE